MDGQIGLGATSADELMTADTAQLEETSNEFLGRWNRLVSTTNWEKGRIISEWRKSLLRAGAPVQVYSDDAWARRVGNVSPQHVGRLRRVHEQFSDASEQYAGLFWSHFQASLDWHDAEMWLEGAVQSGWSVAEMRRQRGVATGALEEPQDGEATAAEMDEDSDLQGAVPDTLDETIREVHSAETGGDSEGDEHCTATDEPSLDDAPFDADDSADAPAAQPVRPFENLPPLPDDLHDAFEALKLAILNHKVSGWQAISREDLLTVLESLKLLALAPGDC